MTITYVGTGTAATGNNASVTPGAISGVTAGDLVVIQASIRNSIPGVVNTPTGWTVLRSQGGHVLLARKWQTGDSLPLITFTGGVANADTIARAFAFRGVSAEVIDTVPNAAQTNASAQNIAYPALNVPGAGHAVLLSVWKQDDATTLSTPAGYSAVGAVITTTGDDALQATYYQVQTTEADISSGSVTVTGGAAAVSASIVVALKPEPAVAVTEQESWPPRAQIAVTGLTLGDNVETYRIVGGQWTAVRAGSTTATDPSFIVVDAELPFGLPVSYAVYVNGIEYLTAADTYELTGGKVALTDAITGAAAEAIIGAAGDKTYARDSARFRVAGRNLVVSGPMAQAEGSYELLATTTSNRDGIMYLLANATQGIVQMRQAGGTGADGNTYDGIDAYLAVDQVTERRWSQDGSDPRRLIVIEYAEVDGWAPSFAARGFTLQDIADYFAPNGTLQDIADFVGPGGTLLDIALTDWTP